MSDYTLFYMQNLNSYNVMFALRLHLCFYEMFSITCLFEILFSLMIIHVVIHM